MGVGSLTFIFSVASNGECVGLKTRLDLQYKHLMPETRTGCNPTFGLLKWITVPSSLIMLTSSMPGMLLTGMRDLVSKEPITRIKTMKYAE